MGSALTHAVGWRYACRGRGNAPRSSSKGLLSACDNASTPESKPASGPEIWRTRGFGRISL